MILRPVIEKGLLQPILRPVLSRVGQIVHRLFPWPSLFADGTPGFRINVEEALRLNKAAIGSKTSGFTPDELSRCVAFQDSAGTLPVTAMEQPLGLILDTKLGVPVRGAELVTGDSANFSGGIGGWAKSGVAIVSASAGVAQVTGGANYADKAELVVSGSANKAVLLEADVWVSTGTARVALRGTASPFPEKAFALLTNTTPTRIRLISLPETANLSVQIIPWSGNASQVVYFDNISVRELPGNHFIQPSNTASRPIVSRRVNLLTATENAGDATWQKITSTVTAGGGVVSSNATTPTEKFIQQVGLAAVGGQYRATVRVKAGQTGWLVLSMFNQSSVGVRRYFDLTTGTVGSAENFNGGVDASASIEPVGDGWYDCTLGYVANSSTSTVSLRVQPAQGDLVRSYQAANTTEAEIFVGRADLRLSSDVPGLPSYQRVTSSTDYDEVGFPAYARADGLDDWLESGVVDMSSTDAVTVIAGVKKRSDAAYQVVVDFSTNPDTTAGAFGLGASTLTGDAARRTYGFGSSGQFFSLVGAGIYAAPSKNLLTGIGRISTDTRVLRINGVQAASSSADQGVGNYGAHKFFLLRRAGASLPFNGRLYGVTVIGKLLTDSQLAAAEQAERQLGRLY